MIQVDCSPTLLVHPAAVDEAVALLSSFDPAEWNDTSYVAAPPQQHLQPQPGSSNGGWAANTGVFGKRPCPLSCIAICQGGNWAPRLVSPAMPE